MFNKKAENKPNNTNPNNNCIRNKQRTLIPRKRFSNKIINNLNDLLYKNRDFWKLTPIIIILP